MKQGIRDAWLALRASDSRELEAYQQVGDALAERLKVAEHMVAELQKTGTRLLEERRAVAEHRDELLLAMEDEGLIKRERRLIAVQPAWCRSLPLQQQSVLLLASRGPDDIAKRHPCKAVHVAYRGTVLVAARYGRCLEWGEKADSFMSLDVLADDEKWGAAVGDFFRHKDGLPVHYILHFMHGAEIIGYKHPDQRFRDRWFKFYLDCVEDMHLYPESAQRMDERLGDWGRRHW